MFIILRIRLREQNKSRMELKMTSPFGLHNTTKEWGGPIIREFKKISGTHTNVVRYQCPLETRVFDWYVPKFFFSEIIINDNAPDILVVEIGKSDNPRQTVGFSPQPIPLRIGEGICEYEFVKEMEHSYRYDIVYEAYRNEDNKQTYALYIPKEEFGAEVTPKVVYVKLLEVRNTQ